MFPQIQGIQKSFGAGDSRVDVLLSLIHIFAQYLDDTCLDSRQIYFVNQIVEYIVHNGMLKDLSVLQESPFTDQGLSLIHISGIRR